MQFSLFIILSALHLSIERNSLISNSMQIMPIECIYFLSSNVVFSNGFKSKFSFTKACVLYSSPHVSPINLSCRVINLLIFPSYANFSRCFFSTFSFSLPTVDFKNYKAYVTRRSSNYVLIMSFLWMQMCQLAIKLGRASRRDVVVVVMVTSNMLVTSVLWAITINEGTRLIL